MESLGSTVIINGKFNPAEYHPAWLFQCGVESKSLESLTTINNCSENYSSFSISGSNYSVDRNNFNITSSFITVAEIIDSKLVKLFCELSPNIPTISISLMKFIHFKLDNLQQWRKICSRFAPSEPWNDVGFEIKENETGWNSGLNSLRMRNSENLKHCNLVKSVTIERSLHFRDSIGAFVMLDFLYSFETDQPVMKLVELAQSEAVSRTKEADNTFKKFKELN